MAYSLGVENFILFLLHYSRICRWCCLDVEIVLKLSIVLKLLRVPRDPSWRVALESRPTSIDYTRRLPRWTCLSSLNERLGWLSLCRPTPVTVPPVSSRVLASVRRISCFYTRWKCNNMACFVFAVWTANFHWSRRPRNVCASRFL